MKYIVASIILLTLVLMGFMHILANANPEIFDFSSQKEINKVEELSLGEFQVHWESRIANGVSLIE